MEMNYQKSLLLVLAGVLFSLILTLVYLMGIISLHREIIIENDPFVENWREKVEVISLGDTTILADGRSLITLEPGALSFMAVDQKGNMDDFAIGPDEYGGHCLYLRVRNFRCGTGDLALVRLPIFTRELDMYYPECIARFRFGKDSPMASIGEK